MSCACVVSDRHDSESPTFRPFRVSHLLVYSTWGLHPWQAGKLDEFDGSATYPTQWVMMMMMMMMMMMNSGIFLHSMLGGASTHWRDWGVPGPDNSLQVPTGEWGGINAIIPI